MNGGEPRHVDVTSQEARALLERVRASMSSQDYETIKATFETHAFLVRALEDRNISIGRLRRMLFGASTESSKNLFPGGKKARRGRRKKKPKGHGRNGADAYTGARQVFIAHPDLRPGDPCPNKKCTGKVYDNVEPATIVRIHGNPMMTATVNRVQKLRCNLCGEVFTAPLPPGDGEKKYDEQAAANIAVFKYGSGLPFHRLRVLQEGFGIPLPESTQWGVVKPLAGKLEPVYEELVRQAAQGKVLHNDDTPMKILSLMQSTLEEDGKRQEKSRTGIFTSGVLSVRGDLRICLFFTGRLHAGEALDQVLGHRDEKLALPIQMSDALSRNTPKEHRTIQANCNSHGRRGFADVATRFPKECRYVIDLLAEVFRHEATTRKQNMSDRERLLFHQEHSAPIMDELHAWLVRQFEEKLVEPNSGLGEAISYMINHWNELTLFLRKAGAPLENNAVERALKVVILHRKNSYFFKTQNGARVGDIFMTIIHTCRLNKVNVFDYLNTLQQYSDTVVRDPPSWLPWNYTRAVQALLKN